MADEFDEQLEELQRLRNNSNAARLLLPQDRPELRAAPSQTRRQTPQSEDA